MSSLRRNEQDWSVADRKRLYRACRRVIETSGLTWSDLYKSALGSATHTGIGYEDNFRAGRIARGKAARILSWLQSAYPEEAREFDIEAPVAPHRQAGAVWEKIISEHYMADALEICAIEKQPKGIVTLADTTQLSDQRLRLGQSFCLRLHCPIAGTAIGFQAIGYNWYSLPLTDNDEHPFLEKRIHLLPASSEDHSPLPLSEDVDRGRHRFAVIIQSTELPQLKPFPQGTPITLTRLDQLADELLARPQGSWVLATIAVLVTD